MAASGRAPGRCMHATAFVLTLLYALSLPVSAVVPTGSIAFQLHHQSSPQFASLLGSPSHDAGWGVSLPQIQNSRWKHIHMQALDAEDPFGCSPYALPPFPLPMGVTTDPYKALVVVDRGNCSFLQKTQLAMAAGARGVIIRGSKKAVYDSVMSQNKTNTTSLSQAADPLGPKPVFEYDCANGEAFVTKKAEPAWATDDVKCATNPLCESRACVLTGEEDTAKGGFQVCCLWDTPVLMGVGNRTYAKNVSVPVVYVTIADGKQLERSWMKFPQLLVRTFAREIPLIDASSLLLWVIGVATAVAAAYYSASAERDAYKCRTDPEYLAMRQQQQLENNHSHRDEDLREDMTWEIDGKTAVGFIIGAALFLTIFYYIKVVQLIPVLFALSATGTFTQLVTAPLFQLACIPAVKSRQVFIPVLKETWPLSELLGLIASATLAIVWFVHRRTAWYLQDIFGISLCFIFLRTVQLPSLKVASILLSLAFCYDVFFVFISPLVFGSSVMEDVATGGPAAYTRSDYPGIDCCERYPKYAPCIDPEPMPMLLVLPRFLNWLGGVSMLGLGDIILPGLLLSYALRFDYSTQSLGENYFRSVCIGYAVGLGMANMAVNIMQIGQPALMYLVPTCLGTIIVQSKWNGDFKAMWLGLGTKDGDIDKRYEAEQGHGPVVVLSEGPHDQAPLLGASRPGVV